MQTDIDLDRAISAGVIDEQQAIALRKVEAKNAGLSQATSEKFQLFGGFSDIMSAIGLAMVLIGCIALLGRTIGSVFCLAIAPALFTLGKKINMRAWPCTSMVILIGYLGALFLTLPFFIMDKMQYSQNEFAEGLMMVLTSVPLALIGGWIFWKTFRFPATLAAMAFISAITIAALLDGIFSTLPWIAAGEYFVLNASLLIVSICILAFAIWWDLTDIRRETERSQVAFWLHCCAGFLISHSAFALITGTHPYNDHFRSGLGLEHAGSFVLTFTLFAMISLLLDRRAMLLGAVIPAITFFSNLQDPTLGVIATGLLLLAFSWGWTPMRKGFLRCLPVSLAAQLPRTDVSLDGQRPTRRHLELVSRKRSQKP